jgi:DNA-binding MarR family transcriptional regulator
MLPIVILGLVPRIQASTNAGTRGWMDGRDKPDHDKLGIGVRVTTPDFAMLARERTDVGPETAQLHALIAVKLWENPSWLSFRINYLGLQFNVPIYGWIEQRYRLARPDMVALYSLGLRDGLAAKDICASSGFPKNTMSRAVQKLVRRKLIRRAPDPADRRSYVLRLTREGRRIFDEALLVMVERERIMLAGLSAEERRLLSKLLARMVVQSPNWSTHVKGSTTHDKAQENRTARPIDRGARAAGSGRARSDADHRSARRTGLD